MQVPESNVSPTACQIRAALEQIASSTTFSKSGQLASFLRYVVQETLAGRGERIKAYTIATSALGRDENFDPQIDPIVRVEAGRLRRALQQYYAKEGIRDPVIIDLPVGHYMPVFRHMAKAPQSAGAPAGWWRSTLRALRENRRLLLTVILIAAVVSLSVDLLGMLVSKTVWPTITHMFSAGPLDSLSTGSLGH